jgi:hypothetical protein
MYNEMETCFAEVLSLIQDLMDYSHIGVSTLVTLMTVITIQTTQLLVGKYTMWPQYMANYFSH